MTEESEECDKMFNEVDDGEWDISDDDADDLQSDGGKEKYRVTGNIKEMKRFHLSLLCFVDFLAIRSVMVFYMVVAGESVHPTSFMNYSLFENTFQ